MHQVVFDSLNPVTGRRGFSTNMQVLECGECVCVSRRLEEKQHIAPACGRRSSPPLHAAAAVKVSLGLRCEVR